MFFPFKLFVLFAVLPALVSSAAPARKKTDREVHGLQGQVRTVTSEFTPITEADGKSVEGERTVTSVDSYDATGALITVENYRHGKLAERITYFDLDGQRAYKSEELIVPDSTAGVGGGSGGPGHRGKPDARYSLKFKYQYDSAGNRVREDYITAWGDRSAYVETKFDTHGNRIQRIAYSGDGQRLNKTFYKYDNKGNLVEESMDRVGVRTYSDYQIDSSGNWISRKYDYVWSSRNIPPGRGIETRTITYF